MTRISFDDITFGLTPEFDKWAKAPTFDLFEPNTQDNLNVLKGIAAGQQYRIDELQRELAEAEEKVTLARAYQREMDARAIAKSVYNINVQHDESRTLGGGIIEQRTWVTTEIIGDVDAQTMIRGVSIDD